MWYRIIPNIHTTYTLPCKGVPVLVLLFNAVWFILRGDLFEILPCVIMILYFSVLLALRLPRLGNRELILVFFIRLFGLRSFGFVCFLYLLLSGMGCGLWLWHSLDVSLTFCFFTSVQQVHLRQETFLLTSFFLLLFNKSILLHVPMNVGKSPGSVANSVEPDQTPLLHYLLSLSFCKRRVSTVIWSNGIPLLMHS